MAAIIVYNTYTIPSTYTAIPYANQSSVGLNTSTISTLRLRTTSYADSALSYQSQDVSYNENGLYSEYTYNAISRYGERFLANTTSVTQTTSASREETGTTVQTYDFGSPATRIDENSFSVTRSSFSSQEVASTNDQTSQFNLLSTQIWDGSSSSVGEQTYDSYATNRQDGVNIFGDPYGSSGTNAQRFEIYASATQSIGSSTYVDATYSISDITESRSVYQQYTISNGVSQNYLGSPGITDENGGSSYSWSSVSVELLFTADSNGATFESHRTTAYEFSTFFSNSTTTTTNSDGSVDYTDTTITYASSSINYLPYIYGTNYFASNTTTFTTLYPAGTSSGTYSYKSLSTFTTLVGGRTFADASYVDTTQTGAVPFIDVTATSTLTTNITVISGTTTGVSASTYIGTTNGGTSYLGSVTGTGFTYQRASVYSTDVGLCAVLLPGYGEALFTTSMLSVSLTAASATLPTTSKLEYISYLKSAGNSTLSAWTLSYTNSSGIITVGVPSILTIVSNTNITSTFTTITASTSDSVSRAYMNTFNASAMSLGQLTTTVTPSKTTTVTALMARTTTGTVSNTGSTKSNTYSGYSTYLTTLSYDVLTGVSGAIGIATVNTTNVTTITASYIHTVYSLLASNDAGTSSSQTIFTVSNETRQTFAGWLNDVEATLVGTLNRPYATTQLVENTTFVNSSATIQDRLPLGAPPFSDGLSTNIGNGGATIRYPYIVKFNDYVWAPKYLPFTSRTVIGSSTTVYEFSADTLYLTQYNSTSSTSASYTFNSGVATPFRRLATLGTIVNYYDEPKFNTSKQVSNITYYGGENITGETTYVRHVKNRPYTETKVGGTTSISAAGTYADNLISELIPGMSEIAREDLPVLQFQRLRVSTGGVLGNSPFLASMIDDAINYDTFNKVVMRSVTPDNIVLTFSATTWQTGTY